MRSSQRHILVVGNGMVGQRFVERLLGSDVSGQYLVTVVGEESRPAYDRVALSSWFDGATDEDLCLVDAQLLASNSVDYRFNRLVTHLDTESQKATLDDGEIIAYDELVLATGSYPFVPPIPGKDLPGCFVYRTLDDLEAIRDWAGRQNCRVGTVIGGGLLGLEAANALRHLDLEVHVVEMAPYPMPLQLGEGGGTMLSRWVDGLGVDLHCGVTTSSIEGEDKVEVLQFGDDSSLATDMIVFSAGVRPRDELGRTHNFEIGERGGIVVDNFLATSVPNVYAIGEVACHEGRCYGLVAPGYEMAAALAERLTGTQTAEFTGSDLSAKLKLMGVEVASFGSIAMSQQTDELVFADPIAKIHRRLVIDKDSGQLLGGSLVGDSSGYEILRAMSLGAVPTPTDLAPLVLPANIAPADNTDLPDATLLCSCNSVSVGTLRDAIGAGCHSVGALKDETCAAMSCGGCAPAIATLLNRELTKQGVAVSNELCEHFAHSRQELFDLIRFHRYRGWGEILAAHGSGHGCEICRPTVASILASIDPNYVLDGDAASIQDTNDHALANMQRNGTYSVIPRVPGGEITPAQLIVLGEIARDFELYLKITGGQRIGLLGAQLSELPTIWQRVLDAGMESGHAYGKALRTVKSCVGETWCRYGVQDSVGMAIHLEERYRGIRSPHKVKMAVSGCTRECAEAQSKDVGVIATENGWNLYVGGNGGRSPRHADLIASDLSDDELVVAIDRFMMFYVRTADRLQRTSVWLESLDGGIDYLRTVIFDDVLEIAEELEAEMAHHVAGYRCEWEATLADEERLEHFVEFVNAPDATSQPVWITTRNQRVPA